MPYLLIAKSCFKCNSLGIQILKQKPSEEDKDKIIDEVGGMYCIRILEFEIEFGKIIVGEL